jgi:hypothetical protein
MTRTRNSKSPIFSQKHYIAIAAELHKLRAKIYLENQLRGTLSQKEISTVMRAAGRLSAMFIQDNPKFDADKFMDAITK